MIFNCKVLALETLIRIQNEFFLLCHDLIKHNFQKYLLTDILIPGTSPPIRIRDMYNARMSVSLDRQGLQAPDAPSWPDVRIRLLPVSWSQQGCAHQAAMPPGIRITRVSWHCRCSTAPQSLPTLTFKGHWSLDPPPPSLCYRPSPAQSTTCLFCFNQKCEWQDW